MISERCNHGPCRAPRILAVLACSTFLTLGSAASAQEPKETEIAPSVSTTNVGARSALPGILAKHYMSVRSLVVAHGDCVDFEYYRRDIDAQTLSPVFSVTKSALSILIGIAVDGGYLRLDQKLSELLPETCAADVDPRVRDITIRDLLTMTGGFDPAGNYAKVGVSMSESWRWLLSRPIKYSAGSQFSYDEADQNLLSIALTRAIKEDAARFAKRRLFDPLGIKDYGWPKDSDGYLIGSTSLSLTARDMTKIGLLYLQRGRWGTEQIVSESFVVDSSTAHNDGGPPTHAAYGYLWWTNKTKTGLHAFFAAGHKSQLIYVVPELDLVVAVAADSIPGGSVKFVNDVVLPVASELAASPSCSVRLDEGPRG